MRKKLLFVLLLSCVISGCATINSTKNTKLIQEKTALEQISNNSWEIVFGDDDMNDSSIAKMNAYIDVRNYLDPQLNDSIDTYIKRAGNNVDLNINTQIPKNGDLILMSGVDYITKAQSSLKITPKNSFDDIADKYITIFAKLVTKNNELYNYYNTGEDKKDLLAKSKSLHKEYMNLINQYDKIYPSFIKNYDIWFLKLQLDNMRYYKQQWETAKYAVESISLYKKYLMDEISIIDKKINKWSIDVDLTNLNEILTKLQESISYANLQNDNTIITKDLWLENAQTFQNIKTNAEDLSQITKNDLMPLLTSYNKINLEKINTIFDKLYNIEQELVKLRNLTIKN